MVRARPYMCTWLRIDRWLQYQRAWANSCLIHVHVFSRAAVLLRQDVRARNERPVREGAPLAQRGPTRWRLGPRNFPGISRKPRFYETLDRYNSVYSAFRACDERDGILATIAAEFHANAAYQSVPRDARASRAAWNSEGKRPDNSRLHESVAVSDILRKSEVLSICNKKVTIYYEHYR